MPSVEQSYRVNNDKGVTNKELKDKTGYHFHFHLLF